VETRNSSYETKNVILNTPVFSSSKLFPKNEIRSYFNSFAALDSKQGAFVVYMKLKTQKEYANHYQIIEKENFVHTISNALFASFSSKSDTVLSKDGYLSVTISVHTLSSYWLNLQKQEYGDRKNELTQMIVSLICAKLGILKSEIVDLFAATPKTFEKYTGRSSLGGVVMTPSNQLRLASNDTPFEGLFVVGDTSFAAQGWTGVAIGVRNFLCMT
jgi:phytoene dehydrogenase-like protein